MTNKRWNEQTLFKLAAAAAISVHFIALILIHHMEVGFYSPTTNRIEEDGLLDDALRQEGVSRSDQLKEAFKTVYVEMTPTINKTFDISNLSDRSLSSENMETFSLTYDPDKVSIDDKRIISKTPIPSETLIDNLNLFTLTETSNSQLATENLSQQMVDELLDETSIINNDSTIGAAETVEGEGIKQRKRTLPSDSLKAIKTPNRGQQLAPSVSSSSLENYIDTGDLKAPMPSIDEDTIASEGLHYELDQIGKIATSEDFYPEVKYTLNTDGNSYLFEVKLFPKEGLTFKRIRKNVFFIIDRSNSIGKDRFQITKDAVKSALTSLLPGDRFNIYLFDSKVAKLSDEPLELSDDHIEKAQAFLDKQPYGGLFASTDIYLSLSKTIPKVVDKQEINVAVLLSDGGTTLRREQQRKALNRWITENNKKVSIFTVACGPKNNTSHLNLIASYNKGTLKRCDQISDLKPLLKELMEEIARPIGKDIVATAISPKNQLKITLYPKEHRLKDLYDHSPYTFYGKINSLDSFYLYVQGKYYDRWIDLKHEISFHSPHSKTMSYSYFQDQWTQNLAFDQYDRYLTEGKERYLSEAEKLIKKTGKGSF